MHTFCQIYRLILMRVIYIVYNCQRKIQSRTKIRFDLESIIGVVRGTGVPIALSLLSWNFGCHLKVVYTQRLPISLYALRGLAILVHFHGNRGHFVNLQAELIVQKNFKNVLFVLFEE